jgi:nondiscriminating glutamyl-tRNA synthetase
MGWNDGTEQEIFTREELIEKFSLDRVQRSGARFDEKRLEWMNGTWIRSLDLEDIYTRSQDFWPESAASFGDDYKKQVLVLAQERLKHFAELSSLTSYFFEDLPVDMSLIDTNKQLKKFSHSELKMLLETSKTALENSEFTPEKLQETLNQLLETTGQKPGVLFSLIRIATTQAPFSPALTDTMAVLCKEKVIARLEMEIASLE